MEERYSHSIDGGLVSLGVEGGVALLERLADLFGRDGVEVDVGRGQDGLDVGRDGGGEPVGCSHSCSRGLWCFVDAPASSAAGLGSTRGGPVSLDAGGTLSLLARFRSTVLGSIQQCSRGGRSARAWSNPTDGGSRVGR